MRQPRQLFALLLVAIYAIVSTFGAAFLVCVESDGQQNIEALGASCCAIVEAVSDRTASAETPPPTSASDDDDCGGCDDHVPVVETGTTRCEDSRPDPLSTLDPPPPPPALAAWSLDLRLERVIRRLPTRPPPSPPAIACLRSVILRC